MAIHKKSLLQARHFKWIAASLITCLCLTSCQPNDQPAPVSHYGLNKPKSASASSHQVTQITVQPGDTLFAISRRHNLPITDLIRTNELTPPYILSPGQKLTQPKMNAYIVQKGDTLYSISRTFDMDQQEITRLNKLAAPYEFEIGQRLLLTSEQPTHLAAISPQHSLKQPADEEISATKLGSPESINAQDKIRQMPEQKLTKTENKENTPPLSAAQQKAPEKEFLNEPKPKSTEVQPKEVQLTSYEPSQKAPSAAKQPPQQQSTHKSSYQPPARASSSFLWPVKGKVISQYGSKAGGLHNDGINISVPRGTPVKCAENGVVVYSGNELKGFGNLILVKHGEGYMSAYGHLGELQYQKGTKLTRGQILGTVDMTGSVSSPQLHFEIRKGKKTLDPIQYLADNAVAR